MCKILTKSRYLTGDPKILKFPPNKLTINMKFIEFENLCSESNKSIFITYFKLDEMKTLSLWKSGFTKQKRCQKSLVYYAPIDCLEIYFVSLRWFLYPIMYNVNKYSACVHRTLHNIFINGGTIISSYFVGL